MRRTPWTWRHDRRWAGRAPRAWGCIGRLQPRPIVVSLTLAAFVATAGGAFAQPAQTDGTPAQPAARFELGVDVVDLPTVVTDERGAFVPGLTRDEFEVFENGRRQTVTVFDVVDLPRRPPLTPANATAPIDWDVHEARATIDGRLYVLILDDLHTAVSNTPRVRTAVAQFVEQALGANDLAAVVFTSGRAEAGQELTGRRALLLDAVGRFQGRKLPSATGERQGLHALALTREGFRRSLDPDRTREGPARPRLGRDRVLDEFDAPERAYNARTALAAIAHAAEWMGTVHSRRKAIVLFSEGLEYDIYEPFDRSGPLVLADARAAMAAAQQANVSIYPVDVRGLTRLPPDAITIGLSRDPDTPEGTALAFQRELLLAQESLIALADETGGFAVVNTNDLAGGLRRIVRETGRYYLLGYTTNLDDAQGEFRAVDVRVAARPDLTVRTRRGFVAERRPRPGPPEPARADGRPPSYDIAVQTPLRIGDLTFRATASSVKGENGMVSVLVVAEVDGESLRFEARDGRFTERLDLSILVLDARGEIQGGDTHIYDLELQPETHERVRRNGLRLQSRLELPAARYQVRIGAHETVGGSGTAVPFDIVLMDYAEASFALSDLALTSTRAAAVPTPRPDPLLAAVLPAPVTATRLFGPEETLTVFAELYAGPGARRRVGLAVALRDVRDGRAVFALQDDRTLDPTGNHQTHAYLMEIPLTDVPAGIYVLQVDATSPATNEAASRSIPIEVGVRPDPDPPATSDPAPRVRP